MAMTLRNESIEIIVPNSEAYKGAQIKGIKDSTVGGYYIQDDLEKKQDILNFFNDFKLDFEIDIPSVEKYVSTIKKKVYPSKVLFKGELSNLNSNLQMIKDKNGIIPKMCYTGRNGRYLSFVNDDITVNALRSLILGDITKLIIEKHSSKYIIKLELLENYQDKLFKRVDVNNANQLGKILKEYFNQNKKDGIHLFGFDYCYVIKKNNISIKDIIDISGIDESYEIEINNGINLRKLIDERNYLVDSPKPEKNRHIELNFNTGLHTKYEANRIFFGAPGTGKSHTLNEEKNDLLTNKNNYERVTFHPDYSYANFVGAYKPVSVYNFTTQKKEIEYKYVPGPFMRTLVKALKSGLSSHPEIHLLIIEEINRANVAAVFGDVFQLLDRKNNVSEYFIQTSEDMRKYLADEFNGNPNDFETIKVPDNMYIWATMNSAYQGVYPMDTAFKRRWNFTYLGINNNENIINDKEITFNGKPCKWNNVRKSINNYLSLMNINEDKLIGPFFIKPEDITDDRFDEVFKNKVLMYLFEDAGKQRRNRLFKNKSNIYSLICKEYDEKKFDIFEDELLRILNDYKNSEVD